MKLPCREPKVTIQRINYRLGSIPEKVFSGYHILAYYYISWTLAIPEMVSQLQLPYDDEYKLALTLYKPTNK